MAEHIHVALALVKGDLGWLLSRRSSGRVFAGLWEFPGGKMEPGESAPAAAVREVREETGLSVEPVGLLGEVRSAHAGSEVTLHLVHCRPAGGEPAVCDPAIQEVRWVSSTELERLAMPPANAAILERIRGF